MTQDKAIEIANAFMATRSKDWQQIWPKKRLAAKLRQSRRASFQVWEVRSCRDGLDVTNIRIEISPESGEVLYAVRAGGLRELPDEYFSDQATSGL